VDFENNFRGPEEEIRRRQQAYVDYFRDPPGSVADLGCGRGEFLTLLADAGIKCYGVDRHPDMVERCKEQGLEAVVGDALDHLASVEPGTLGGVFSAQMIEHLDVRDVPRFFELAAQALAPGGRCVVETLNPRSLFVFAAAFYVDLGHLRPLHPYTLQFLAEKAGFADVHVDYVSPPPDDLRPARIEATGDPRIDGILDSINENFKRLDDVIFGAQDYAIVATR
jgi:O-antigen chain-terminating methyltransferase